MLSSAALAQDAAPRIHVLIVGDTLDLSIGESVKADVENVHDTFTQHVPPKQLRFTVLTGNQATPPKILLAIQSLSVARGQDTVVVYFSGHGYFEAKSKDHILYPQRTNLPRAQVRTALQQLPARLHVLITDTCSELIRRPPTPGAPPEATEISPLFAALFIAPRGLIDISATKPGEKAIGDQGGGIFTNALHNSCHDHRDEKADWSQVIAWVNERVSSDVKEARQTAYAVSPLADAAAAAGGWRFGAVAVRTDRSARLNGVEVTLVVTGSPAMQLRSRGDDKPRTLVVGQHLLLQINGQPISNEAEFRAAVQKSPREMTVRVHNLETGTTKDYDVTLTR